MPLGGIGSREPLWIKLIWVGEDCGVPVKDKAQHDNIGVDRDMVTINGQLFTWEKLEFAWKISP